MARVALLTLVSALAAIVVVAAAGAAQDDPAMSSLPTVPGTPSSAMLPQNLTCTSMLLGCMVYYQNTTGAEAQDHPLDMCCAPARKVMDGEMYCLCDGLNNQALVAEIGLDVNKGMTMFPNCGVKVPDNVCSDPAASANHSPASSSKSVNGASQGTQFSYSSFLVFLFAMWPLLP